MWTKKQIEKHERKNQIDKLIVEMAEALREEIYVMEKYGHQFGPGHEQANKEFNDANNRGDAINTKLSEMRANNDKNWDKVHAINEILGFSTHSENPVLEMKKEIEELRAALANISSFVSAGIGDEKTTAEQYVKRIKDGITQMTLDSSKS